VKDLSATGSLFSGGFIALGTVAGIVIGAGLTLLFTVASKKRKENKTA